MLRDWQCCGSFLKSILRIGSGRSRRGCNDFWARSRIATLASKQFTILLTSMETIGFPIDVRVETIGRSLRHFTWDIQLFFLEREGIHGSENSQCGSYRHEVHGQGALERLPKGGQVLRCRAA